MEPLLDRVETLRAGLIGLTVTMTVGLLVNDTGVAIPPVALALVLPLLISAGICTWELRATEDMAMTRANPRHRKDSAAGPGPPHS
jgi:hypothetical protein